MKKSILTLGKTLNKAEQKQINGSDFHYPMCECDSHGNKLNQPCEGGCEQIVPPLPDICDVYPDICNL